MPLMKFLSFIAQAITAGLAAAFLYILLVQPDLLRSSGTVVEVRETQPQETPRQPTDGTTVEPGRTGPDGRLP